MNNSRKEIEDAIQAIQNAEEMAISINNTQIINWIAKSVSSTIMDKPLNEACFECTSGVSHNNTATLFENYIQRCTFCGNKGYACDMLDKLGKDSGFCKKCKFYAKNIYSLNMFATYALLRHPNIGTELKNLRMNIETILMGFKKIESKIGQRFGKYLILDIVKYYLSIHQFNYALGKK